MNWTANVTSTAVETSIDSICLPALAFSMLRGASLSTLEIFDIARGQIKALCEQTRELTHDFLDYV